MKKKIVLFCLMIVLTILFCTPAFAEESGTCGAEGDNLTWTLDDSGVLTITGGGEMAIWSDETQVPWHNYREQIFSVTINNDVQSIEGWAFSGCSNLTSVEIPDSVYCIGQFAFSGCSSLTEIELPENLMSIERSAFSGCSGLTEIELPPDLMGIGDSAFYGCSSLTDIEIPAGILDGAIAPAVFSGCSSLTRVEIPDVIQFIRDNVFSGCSSLTDIKIPDSVVSIGSQAFSGCSNLTSVDIPDSVSEMGTGVFLDCIRLMEVKLPSKLDRIEGSMFSGCSSLTSINIPSGVSSIGANVFYECRSLTSVDIPDSVSKMGTDLFHDCMSLTEVKLPSQLDRIEGGMFQGCSSLTNIDIPSGVLSIEGSAFRGCSNLTSISIPPRVTSIGRWAFGGCSFLKEITFTGNAPTIESNSFLYIYSATAYYPANNSTWTSDKLQNYGGSLTWVAVEIGEEDTGFGDAGEKGYSSDVKGTYISGQFSSTVYSIDIEWSSLAFTYCGASAQVWDPETHSYTGVNRPAGWEASDARITVTNHSNASVHALPSYTADTAHTDAWVEFDTVAALVPSAAVANKAEAVTIAVTPRGSFTQPQSAAIGTVTVMVRRAMDDTTAPELRTRISELQQAYSVVQDPAGLPEGMPYILQSDLDTALGGATALANAIDNWDGTAEQLDILYTQHYLVQLQAIDALVRTYGA